MAKHIDDLSQECKGSTLNHYSKVAFNREITLNLARNSFSNQAFMQKVSFVLDIHLAFEELTEFLWQF